VIHPSFDSSPKTWAFATAAYAICCGISTLVVWLGWEVGFEWWRRWRLARPAIEPIYLSLPASLHLSLTSYHHFVFLTHIRLSPLGTPYAKDVYPEACQALLQLFPGLVPLLPRAAIAIVLLTTFSAPRLDLQTPFGATDQLKFRDDHFFRADLPGQLTLYARGVLFAFLACLGIRLAVTIASAAGLWISSGRPLGGLFGKRVAAREPATPRKPKSSLPPRDPSNTRSPQKSWLSAENDFDWAWRDRTRARIQDAFELCMIRRETSFRTGAPWGAQSGTSLPMMTQPSMERTPPMTADEFLAHFVGESLDAHPPGTSFTTPRPESSILPKRSDLTRPPVSRGITAFANASMSTQDVFYTPRETPQGSQRPVTSTSDFGVRRRSGESEESITDDSTALLSSEASSRHSHDEGSDSHHSLSTSSSLRRRAATVSTSPGRALARARSTSVSLLRESLNNGLMKRARSGTMLSTDSRYSKVEDDLEELARECQRLLKCS
jgi:hypothetical protein